MVSIKYALRKQGGWPRDPGGKELWLSKLRHWVLSRRFWARSACSSPPPAAAQTRDPVQLISEADANGDGAVSWAEVTKMRTQTFSRLDRNGDRVISSADRPRGAFGARFDQAFANVKSQFDANGDNRVSRSEMVDAPSPVFDRGDTNGDRILSAEELAALRSAAPAK